MQIINTIRLFLLSLLLTFALAACSGEDVPPDVLSVREMVPVMKDMQIAYAGVDVTVQKPDQRQAKYDEMNRLVLDKYGIEKDRFFSSYQYYQERPVLMDSSYMKIIEELSTEIVPLQEKKKGSKGRVPEAQ